MASTTTTSQDSPGSRKRPHSFLSTRSPVFLDPACQAYSGYLPMSNDEVLDTVDASAISPQDFFARYVAARRPCLLVNAIPPETPPVTLQTLTRHAGSVRVQVEKLQSPVASFGQNRSDALQAEMPLSELLSLPRANLHQYYLSTQHFGQDEEDAYPDSPLWQALSSVLEPVATRLAKQLSGHLLLESRHLWLGFATATAGGSSSSSGLHHDYHDNFNLVLRGRKHWALFPPTEYPNIPVHGTVQGMHGVNGLLSYRDHPTRADGVPLALVLASQLLDDEDEEDDDDEREGDEEDVVLGFGADYVSEEEDSGREDQKRDSKDPGNYRGKESLDSKDGAPASESKRRPNSFSPVDLTLDAAELSRRHPDFAPLRRIDATVRAGEALYLPASWFHCVTSSSHEEAVNGAQSSDADDPPYHLALNFWYHPPDQSVYERPYRDSYWEQKQKGKFT